MKDSEARIRIDSINKEISNIRWTELGEMRRKFDALCDFLGVKVDFVPGGFKAEKK